MRQRASWVRRMKSCSHRKWQTCWLASVFWLNCASLCRVVNYLWALKNLKEREGEVGVGKINAMNGWRWRWLWGGRWRRWKRETGGEQQFEEKRDWMSRKREMRKGTLCKYQQTHYHFKTLERKSQKSGEKHIFGLRQIHSHSLHLHLSFSFTLTHTSPPLSLILYSSLLSHFSACDFYFCAHLASDFTCSVWTLSRIYTLCSLYYVHLCYTG